MAEVSFLLTLNDTKKPCYLGGETFILQQVWWREALGQSKAVGFHLDDPKVVWNVHGMIITRAARNLREQYKVKSVILQTKNWDLITMKTIFFFYQDFRWRKKKASCLLHYPDRVTRLLSLPYNSWTTPAWPRLDLGVEAGGSEGKQKIERE